MRLAPFFSLIRQHQASLTLFSVMSLAFLTTGIVLGLPGADGDGTSTYNVIVSLAEDQRYTLSRTPGQPVLDYLDFVTWSAGGDLLVQLWFSLLSAAGITALYQLLRSAGARAPLLGALAVALHPLFLAHVGGVGDFAVSLAFVMLALRAGQLGYSSLAGVLVGLASGCRMPYVIFAVPVALLAAPGAGVWGRRARTLLWAGAIAAIAYAPLLSAWGLALLHNFPFRSLSYHVPAFAFRLFVSFGVPFWILLAWLGVLALRRKTLMSYRPTPIDLAAFATIGLGLLILFRVPTKPEISLPILLGITIFLSLRLGKLGTVFLVTCNLVAGVVLLSPYDRDDGRHVWHLEAGHYFKAVEEACDNRMMLETVREVLLHLPEGAVFVGRKQWTIPQARRAKLVQVDDVDGISGLTGFRFREDTGGRLLVSFQDGKLRELLEHRHGLPGGGVYYDSRLAGMLRRWMNIEIGELARPVVVGGQSLRRLLSVAGRSVEDTAAPSK